MTKVNEIIDQLKSLTLLEAAELVTAIEDTFNVSATSAGGGVVMMAGGAGAAQEVEEKTEFDLILEEVPADKKIAILKVVRAITGLGIK
jgi:large subunit ribosomal protein L7/L12